MINFIKILEINVIVRLKIFQGRNRNVLHGRKSVNFYIFLNKILFFEFIFISIFNDFQSIKHLKLDKIFFFFNVSKHRVSRLLDMMHTKVHIEVFFYVPLCMAVPHLIY